MSGPIKFLTSLRSAKLVGRFINLQEPLPGSNPEVKFIYVRPEYEQLWAVWNPQGPQPGAGGKRCGSCPR